MSKEWVYSKLAQDAKLNGGPEKYLRIIKEDSYRKGRLDGMAKGRSEVLIVDALIIGAGLLSFAGYKIYAYINDKHEKESIEKNSHQVNDAEAAYIKEINEIKQKIDNGDVEVKVDPDWRYT